MKSVNFGTSTKQTYCEVKVLLKMHLTIHPLVIFLLTKYFNLDVKKQNASYVKKKELICFKLITSCLCLDFLTGFAIKCTVSLLYISEAK